MTGWIMKEHGVPDSKLIVISEDISQKSNKGEIYWNCQCECGKQVIVIGKHLRSGNTKSCGCLKKDIMQEHHKSKHIDMIG